MAEAPRMRIADLDDQSLEKVRALEEEMGACVLALEPKVKLKDLSEEQLEKLKSAEEELGVVLMAYDCK
ncbi:MAG: hypothetical protein R6X31_00265 [Anaerolineae bacterium]